MVNDRRTEFAGAHPDHMLHIVVGEIRVVAVQGLFLGLLHDEEALVALPAHGPESEDQTGLLRGGHAAHEGVQ